jgi:uncharacterized protein (TIGR03435 family)
MRRLFLLLAVVSGIFAQTPLKFEVASVKPATTPRVPIIDASLVDFTAPLSTLIGVAYKVRLDQISGPDWVFTTRYDVQAKLPDGSTEAQAPEMLQTLLAERFKLQRRRPHGRLRYASRMDLLKMLAGLRQQRAEIEKEERASRLSRLSPDFQN